MTNYVFNNPIWFLALILIPILIFLRIKKNKQNKFIELPNAHFLEPKKTIFDYINIILFINKLIIIILIIIALARPQEVSITEEVIEKNGFDIILSMDISYSMLARDLQPDRISVLKDVAEKFIQDRIYDRIGIVVYAAEAITKVPLTSDKNILIKIIKDIQPDENLAQGTAIGMGLATAINHLKDSKAKSKIILLMTDGMNNAGTIDPILASEIAKQKNIKVYTIGIGTNGLAEMPTYNPINGDFIFQNQQVQIDEEILKQISKNTNGKYFRAKNKQELSEIYNTINKLEKSKIEDKKQFNHQEKYRIFIIIALILFLIEFLSKIFIFKSII